MTIITKMLFGCNCNFWNVTITKCSYILYVKNVAMLHVFCNSPTLGVPEGHLPPHTITIVLLH